MACDPDTCQCTEFNPHSPIIIAVGTGTDYPLVGAAEGVSFDIDANGTSDQIGWTSPGSLVAFLALDRNENGIIDHGAELFGTATPLSGSATARHGFEALAYFDRLENGGNGDGRIDSRDDIWPRLLLWVDSNHNGFSEPQEIRLLSDSNFTSIGVEAGLENRQDQFGNLFRYRGFAYLGNQARPIYDVFFASEPRRK